MHCIWWRLLLLNPMYEGSCCWLGCCLRVDDGLLLRVWNCLAWRIHILVRVLIVRGWRIVVVACVELLSLKDPFIG